MSLRTIAAPDYVVSETRRRAIGPDGTPLGRSPMHESKIMTAETCARRIATQWRLESVSGLARRVVASFDGRASACPD
jgi:hypothetical protein